MSAAAKPVGARRRGALARVILPAVLLVTLLAPAVASARPGQLDPSFGRKGIVVDRTPQDPGPVVDDLVVQRNGRIIVAGGNRIVRYHWNGRRDRTFHTPRRSASAMALTTGDRIVLVSGDAVERVRRNGAPDTSGFGAAGTARTILPNLDLRALTLQPDRRILVGGHDTVNGGFVLARLLSDGSLDPSFGVGGIVNTAISTPGVKNLDGVQALAVQPGGAIIAAGRSGQEEGCSPPSHCWGPYLNAAVVRYRSDGTVDANFGEQGIFRATSAWGGVGRVLPRPNGGVLFSVRPPTGAVLAGEGTVGLTLAALSPGGQLAHSYGKGGISQLVGPYDRYVGPVPYSMVPQSRGRVIVVGGNAHPDEFLLARLRANGRADRTFGRRGLVHTRIGRRRAYGVGSTAIGLGPGGRIVVGGGAPHRIAIVRYLNR